MHILIVGGGLGGLSCAIGCLRGGLEVTVIEQDAELTEYGAGIQVPPNAARVMHSYGLLDTLVSQGGAFGSECIYMRRYDGELLTKRPLRFQHQLGFDHYTIHRVDYQRVLATEARRLGVKLRLGLKVKAVKCSRTCPVAELDNEETIEGDVVIGADGTLSTVRTSVLGKEVMPHPTGDIAWRATMTREQIEASQDEDLIRVTGEQQPIGWFGPGSHVAFYPLRNGSIYNFVLARPGELPSGVIREGGDLESVRAFFVDWDPLLQAVLSLPLNVNKWALSHLEPLDTWVNGAVALMGDACHPTLPYQAQGAAMAVEDGATIAELLSLVAKRHQKPRECPGESRMEADDICRALRLYEKIRKHRTEHNVRGAEAARTLFHLPLGPEVDERNRMMRTWDWNNWSATSKWPFFDPAYTRELLSFDAEKASREAFEAEFGDAKDLICA